MKNRYYIGPAGWSYKDWDGIVYPLSKDKNFHQLKYISRFFDTVEINSSFYRPPTAQTTKKWITLVKENPNFTFTYKLWQEFTHQRDTFPSSDKEDIVKSGLNPLTENAKLGALLIQFPWSFKHTTENRAWLDKVINIFKDYHPVIELRHVSWNDNNFFDYLRDKNVGFANIDQPVIGKSLGVSAKITSNVAYFRLHGRNYDNWFKDNVNAASRYDYLYRFDELSDLSTTLSTLIENSPKTYIIFNNHYRGQAIANALQTMYLFKQQKISVPQTMPEYFSDLQNIARSEEHEGQISIFQ